MTTTALATPQTYLSTGKLSSTLNLITPDKETGSLDLSVGASGGKGPPPAKKHKGLSPPVTTTGSTTSAYGSWLHQKGVKTAAVGRGRAIAPNVQLLDIPRTTAPVQTQPGADVIKVKKYGVTDLPKGKGFKIWRMPLPTKTGTTGTTTPMKDQTGDDADEEQKRLAAQEMLVAQSGPTVPTTTASSSSAPLPRKKRYLLENPPSPLKAAVPTTTAQSSSSTGPSATPTTPRLTTTFTEVYDDKSSASDGSPPKMGENVAYDDSDDDLYDD